MTAIICKRGVPVGVLLLSLMGLFAWSEAPAQDKKPQKEDKIKKVKAANNVYILVEDKKPKAVMIEGMVCLRKGLLEHLMCRRHTKEHEAILTAEVDARDIHKTLQAIGADPGRTVRFQPEFAPPSGTKIKITLEYQEKGKTIRVAAQKWIRNVKTQKDLDVDWVFAGSRLYPNPLDDTKPPIYGANEGDVICVSNFPTAMLDLPINSSKDNDDLTFEAHTERIPPLETRVWIILEPELPKKKK
jgi:hypothetical protein